MRCSPPLLLSSILHAQPLRPHYHVLHREAIFIEAAGEIDLRRSGCGYKLEERGGGSAPFSLCILQLSLEQPD